MKRRHFLNLLGLAGVGVIASPVSARAAGSRSFPGNPDAFAVLHDTTLCTGCRKCEEGCAKVNELPAPAQPFDDLSVLENKRNPDIDLWTVVNKYQTVVNGQSKTIFRKHQCNHCLEPACASACFVKALSKSPDGPVTYDPKLCVGCRYCMMACPYYVPAYDYHNVRNPLVYKCTMCADRIRAGKLPGCVEACPVGSITFGKRTDLLRLAWGRIRSKPDIYVEHVYGEHEMGGSSWLYLNAVPGKDLGLPALAKASAPELTIGMLGSAAMITGIAPALLAGVYAVSKRRKNAADQEPAGKAKEDA